MFNIDLSNKIEISRGDSGSGILFLNQSDYYLVRYRLQQGDELYLGVFEPNSCFEESLIRKKYSFKDLNENGDLIVRFSPEDTINLRPGLYYYQVKLRTPIDYVEPEEPELDFRELREAIKDFKEAVE